MPKKESEIRKKINEMAEENEYYNLQQNKNRARSITCGTAFGGTIEVNMRGDHHSMWCSMTPVEALEFAEQMAAACGVQVALRPKDDFSAWRGWDIENTEYSHFKGAAPWQVHNIAGANVHQSRLGGSGGTAGTPVEDEYPSKEERIAEFKRQRDEAQAELENLEKDPEDIMDDIGNPEIAIAGVPTEKMFDQKVQHEADLMSKNLEAIKEQQEAQNE